MTISPLRKLMLYRILKWGSSQPKYFSTFQHKMVKSKFEYVRGFEQELKCLPNSWIVVRIDGKGFHRFADLHKFEKPNDKRGLELMTRAAVSVLEEFRDISIAFGHSDEYSFVFRRDTTIYSRRYEKIVSLVSSLFGSSYVFYWGTYFPSEKLLYPPAFDARAVLFPTDENLRDYMSWRQADAHVNNLYNTCFWALVLKKNLSTTEAEEKLRGTLSSDKNEILFKDFGINYNNEPEMFKKGTTLIRKFVRDEKTGSKRHAVIPFHGDIIKNPFWKNNPEILGLGKLPEYVAESGVQIFPMSYKATLEKALKKMDNSAGT